MKAKARNSIRLSTVSAVELLFTKNVVVEVEAVTVVAAAAVAVVTDSVVTDVVGAAVVPITSISS